jgi:hypothetical protein
MNASGAQWIGMNTIGWPDAFALATVMWTRFCRITSIAWWSSSLCRNKSFIIPVAPRK